MTTALLFVLGTIFGSFLNVIALRYDPDEFLFRRASIGGRSHCPGCRLALRWFELIPLVSFIIQRGRCRRCEVQLSTRYVLVEVLCGFLFCTVGSVVLSGASESGVSLWSALLWFAVFATLFLVTLIDIRLFLIPDEANVMLAVFGVVLAAREMVGGNSLHASLVGPLGTSLNLSENAFVSHLLGAGFAALFFGLLILVTRGRGMGEGDLKLGAALGLVFGWPDTLFIMMLAFVLGAAVGIGAMLAGRKGLKSALPFGPFLAVAALILFAGGLQVANFLSALVSSV